MESEQGHDEINGDVSFVERVAQSRSDGSERLVRVARVIFGQCTNHLVDQVVDFESHPDQGRSIDPIELGADQWIPLQGGRYLAELWSLRERVTSLNCVKERVDRFDVGGTREIK